jgi:hypothetical protein
MKFGPFFFLGLLSTPFLTSSLFANSEAQNCYNDNSCWRFENNLNKKVTVQCVDDRGYFPNTTWSVDGQQLKSVQFNTGWGDGMGFPEPGVPIQCTVKSDDGRSVKTSMHTLDWGDAVRFSFYDNNVIVLQNSTWNPAVNLQTKYQW